MASRIKGVILLIIFFIVCMGVSVYVSRYMLTAYPVEGDSMEPNIHNGDKVILLKTQSIDYDDIIVLDSDTYEKCLIKRVVGLPGDTIEIKYSVTEDRFHVYRNGEFVTEKFIEEPMTKNYYEMEMIVPEGKVFFLGDNRNYSLDSHRDGVTEDIGNVKGKVLIRYNGLDINFMRIGV